MIECICDFLTGMNDLKTQIHLLSEAYLIFICEQEVTGNNQLRERASDFTDNN